jgi:hypothetical protein
MPSEWRMERIGAGVCTASVFAGARCSGQWQRELYERHDRCGLSFFMQGEFCARWRCSGGVLAIWVLELTDARV